MIKRNLLQNTDHYWLALGDQETAQEAARDLLGACDRHAIHHTNRKQLHTGVRHEERKTRGTSKTKDGFKERKTESTNTAILSIPEYEILDEPVYESGADQLLWKAQSLQEQGVGECWVRRMGSRPFQMRIPLVEDSWVFPAIPEFGIESLSAKKVKECLDLLKTQPEYETPIPIVPPGQRTPTPLRQNATKASKNGSTRSAPPPRNRR